MADEKEKPQPEQDPTAAHRASAEKNSRRMMPGNVETDETTGRRLIHPAGNPQAVNPIHDAEHEDAAVEEAKVLTDKDAKPHEKIEATRKANQAEATANDRRAAQAQRNE